jgi:hypothetical protein
LNGIESMRHGRERGQLPVAEVAGEDQRRLAVAPQLLIQLGATRVERDAAVLRAGGIVIPQLVEMSELGTDPSEIIPDPGQDGLDFRRRLFRKRGGEIGAADAVFAQFWADPARDAAEAVGGSGRIEVARGAQQSDGQRADGGFAQWFGRIADAGLGAKQQAAHQK